MEHFLEWSSKEHPNVIRLIDMYENPYPSLKGVDKNMLIENDTIKPNLEKTYLKICFISTVGTNAYRKNVKKFSKNESFLYIKNWIGSAFQIKDMNSVVLKFRRNEKEVLEVIDDYQKDLSYYGIVEDCDMTIDCKEE